MSWYTKAQAWESTTLSSKNASNLLFSCIWPLFQFWFVTGWKWSIFHFPGALRPDILISSTKLKKVILVELTCPAEEGFQSAQLRKQSKYLPLVQNISQSSSWKPLLLTVEVGARGFVAISTHQVLLKLGLPSRKVSSLCKTLSTTAAKCSYTIYLSSNSKTWDHNRPLLDSITN